MTQNGKHRSEAEMVRVITEYLDKAHHHAASEKDHVACWGRLEIQLAEPALRWLAAEEARGTRPDIVTGALELFIIEFIGPLIMANVSPSARDLTCEETVAYFGQELRRWVAAAYEVREEES